MLSRTETSGDFGKVAESGGENGILNLVEILAFSIFFVILVEILVTFWWTKTYDQFWWRKWDLPNIT